MAYEPSRRPKGQVLRDRTTQEPAQNPLSEARAGSRCPRPHCGGLLILRAVVTVDGSCDEVVCSSCSRSVVLALHEPYRPMPRARHPLFDAPGEADRPGAARRDTDDSMGIVPPGDARDGPLLYTVWSDESLPLPPLDSH